MILYDECPTGDDEDSLAAQVEQRPYSVIVESLANKTYSELLSMYGDVHRNRMIVGASIEIVED
jgi:hypothetical protein